MVFFSISMILIYCIVCHTLLHSAIQLFWYYLSSSSTTTRTAETGVALCWYLCIRCMLFYAPYRRFHETFNHAKMSLSTNKRVLTLFSHESSFFFLFFFLVLGIMRRECESTEILIGVITTRQRVSERKPIKRFSFFFPFLKRLNKQINLW